MKVLKTTNPKKPHTAIPSAPASNRAVLELRSIRISISVEKHPSGWRQTGVKPRITALTGERPETVSQGRALPPLVKPSRKPKTWRTENQESQSQMIR